MKPLEVTSLDELDDALEDLRQEKMERDIEVDIAIELDNETLMRLANRIDVIGELLEASGECRLSGEISPDDVEGPGLEKRVEDLAERVEDLSRDLASM